MDFSDPVQAQVFFEIHSDLPRESPGSDSSTIKALNSVVDRLAPGPLIGDFGCGPGSSAIPLARALPHASVIALDLYYPFVQRVYRRAQMAGVARQVMGIVADMARPPIPCGSLDIIWSEGAIYNLGVEAALRAWRALLKPEGVIVFNDAIWRVPAQQRHPDAITAWSEYPGMMDHPGVSATIAAAGYHLLDSFILPDRDWWEPYYTPIEQKLAQLEAKYAGNQAAGIPLREAREEIALRRQYAEIYDYCFYCIRLAEDRDGGHDIIDQ